jgi:biotin-independent malonate decarboxylase gamma subunit
VSKKSLIGQGRKALGILVDSNTFEENVIGGHEFDSKLGPCAIIGSASLLNQQITIIANDAQVVNPRFRLVYAGLIGLEEAYKMALAVYWTIDSDLEKAACQKRPILLIVDTPGNGAGKKEEFIGIHKATGAYQLALAEARKLGHPIVAVIIGRAISGGFLCHGLQADRIISLSKEHGVMVHVMPLSSIARITKINIETLEEMSKENPVFASGVDFFHSLGGVDQIVDELDQLPQAITRQIEDIRDLKESGQNDLIGPWGRGDLGSKRCGRQTRQIVIDKMFEHYESIIHQYL